ncbi:MAG: hypothetical protein ABI239_05770 [Aquihabitans sp.]
MRRWATTLIPAVVLVGALAGCSGSSGGAEPTTSSIAVDFDVTTTLPPEELAVVAECDAKIRAATSDLATTAFPESSDVQWELIDVVTEVGLSFVEVEPVPADGRYPRYRLVVECHAANEPVLYGVYAFADEIWTLWMTTDELGDVELPQLLG